MVAISAALSVLKPSAVLGQIGGVVISSDGVESIAYWPPALGTQPTQVELIAVTQIQVDAALLTKLRAAAKQYHLNLQSENRALRATVKLVVDELNILRQWMTDMKTQTALSTNYATLKTGIATLSATPQRTYVQARTAIETLIDGES